MKLLKKYKLLKQITLPRGTKQKYFTTLSYIEKS